MLRGVFTAIFLLFPFLSFAAPSWQHALTLYGEPKYSAGFRHFDYVNPDAPKGGAVRLASSASFDNLNPFITKGVKAPGIGMVFESLMTSSEDEPRTMYGLLASRVRMDSEGRWVEFELRPNARWQDGTPVTPEDVVFSLDTLKEKGDPIYRLTYKPIEKAEKTGKRRVRFMLSQPDNRELPQIVAGMSVFSKAYYTQHDFEKTTLEAPLGSGPYRVTKVDQGRAITYERVADYWGKDINVNIGRYNFARINYDVYRDETVALEAFKAGEYDLRQEYISRNWATAYDNPALRDGRIIKYDFPDNNPQGMQAFFFNLRRSKFADPRVREAIALTMDFEWTNKKLFYGAYKRNSSFFLNTEFAAEALPQGAELALLEPFRNQLPPRLFTDNFTVPVSDGSGSNRKNLLRAQELLNEAGWVLESLEEGVRRNRHTGEVLSVEFMLRQPTLQRVVAPMRRHLKRLGIKSSLRIVDDAQYQKRIDGRDFDIISNWINRGIFFPGIEQRNYWHSSQADIDGSNNMTGIKSEVVDTLLDKLQSAVSLEELRAVGRALDRVLLWQHVVIPHWHSSSFRVARWNKFGLPKRPPKYSLGFNNWWLIEKEKQKVSNH